MYDDDDDDGEDDDKDERWLAFFRVKQKANVLFANLKLRYEGT